jgi:competence protein ComEC
MPATLLLPLPRLVLALVTGILVRLVTGISLPGAFFFLVYGLTVLAGLVLRRYSNARYAGRWFFGALAGLFLVTAGFQLCQDRHGLGREDHFSVHEGRSGLLVLRLREPVSEKANSFQAICQAMAFHTEDTIVGVSGKLMVYLAKDTLAGALGYGDVILLENRFEEVSPPMNPGQFDYKRFLSLGNIFHSAYRATGEWYPAKARRGSRLMSFALSLREKALAALSRSQLEERELAVVSALFLGYREYLTEDLQREFAGAGAMHVLCVSGLHVGIIYLVLKAMLGFLGPAGAGYLVRTLLVVAFIWLYAAVTGFSPSVLRASTMFTFVAVGQGFRRRTHIYNSLSASALVLLVIDPNLISRIGFQLSYLAVFSIVTLQPRLFALLPLKNPLLKKAWALATVSIAAQLATGPLALFYFNQFPNYFLLTNILVVPLATLIIYVAMAFLALSFWAPAAMASGALLSILLRTLNASVGFVEGLPYATWSNVFISLPEVLVVYLALGCAACYFILHRRNAIVCCLVLLSALSASTGWRAIHLQQHARFVVYHVNRATLVDFFSPGEMVSLSCPRAAVYALSDYQAGRHRIRMGRRKTQALEMEGKNDAFFGRTLLRQGPFLEFHGLRFVLLTPGNPMIPKAWPADYLLVSQGVRSDIRSWLSKVQPQRVIIDASNTLWQENAWVEACREEGFDYWVIREQGAYVRNIHVAKQRKGPG